jgi:5-(aminomethyl)-3-furanmethanol phosphate kinase
MPQVLSRLRGWLARQLPADTILVVGGGALVEAIRAAHALHPLPERTAHWLCVRAMALQADMMLAHLSEAERLVSVAELREEHIAEHSGKKTNDSTFGSHSELRDGLSSQLLMILDPWHFLYEEEPRLAEYSLPESWDVTSDSIAARLAELTQADELVLLKSALPMQNTMAELAENGYVDPFFPTAARKLAQIRFVNLRDDAFEENVLLPLRW